MKSKIIGKVILIAAIAAAVYFGYPKLSEFVWNNTHPLDVIYEYDGQEISVRKLFEASYENTNYASRLNITGIYSDSVSSDLISTVNLSDKTVKTKIGYSHDSSTTNLEYERIYVDSDNYMWTISGDYSKSKSTNITNIHKSIDNNTASTFTYYKGLVDGQDVTYFESSDGNRCMYIDVEKILMPNFDDMTGTTVAFCGTADKEGHFVVTFTGEKLAFIAKAFGETSTSANGFTEITYTFDAKSRTLIGAKLTGQREYEGYDSENKKSQSLSFTITNSSFEEAVTIEIPTIICENSLINKAYTGDAIIQPSPVLDTEMFDDIELSDTITSIWENTVLAFSDGNCSVTDFVTSLYENTKEHGIDLTKDGYVINSQENGILIKFSLSQDEKVIGTIVMPLVKSGDQLSNDNNLLIPICDMMTVGRNGSIKVYHTISDTLTSVTCYRIKNDRFSFAYEIIKESKISNLLNEEELSLFGDSDSYYLRIFASEYGQAAYETIDKYIISEDGLSYAYYVVSNNNDADELADTYKMPFISEKDAKKKIGDDSGDTVEWQEFTE